MYAQLLIKPLASIKGALFVPLHTHTATHEVIGTLHTPPCLCVICGLCNLILAFTQLPVERVLHEQIGCSNSQSMTFPHPGC